jgi:hypothetical protein
MKRLLGVPGLCLFVAGTVVMPTVHSHHLSCEADHGCEERHESEPRGEDGGHDADRCALCRLAGAPVECAAPAVVLLAETAVGSTPGVSARAPVAILLPWANGPRAPPVPA